VVKRLALLWGVEARLVETPPSVEHFLRSCESLLLADKLAERGDLMVFVAGIPFRTTGNTNVLKIHRVGDE
jgi:pyruvate kinase